MLLENIPLYPEIGQNDAAIGYNVDGEFTVGFWPNWGPPYYGEGFYLAADEDGPGGHPWTYIAPDMGPYPSGWQHPRVLNLFRECRSVGIGLYYDEIPAPAEATSWSRLKSLFR